MPGGRDCLRYDKEDAHRYKVAASLNDAVYYYKSLIDDKA